MMRAMLQVVILGQFIEPIVFHPPPPMPHLPDLLRRAGAKFLRGRPAPMSLLVLQHTPTPNLRGLLPGFVGYDHPNRPHRLGKGQIVDFPTLHVASIVLSAARRL